jgi:hypothetical protein
VSGPAWALALEQALEQALVPVLVQAWAPEWVPVWVWAMLRIRSAGLGALRRASLSLSHLASVKASVRA